MTYTAVNGRQKSHRKHLHTTLMETGLDPYIHTEILSSPCCLVFPLGIVAAMLINKYGCRVTTIVGGILTSSGLVLSFFAPNVYFLYFSLGVVSGKKPNHICWLFCLPQISNKLCYNDRFRPYRVKPE